MKILILCFHSVAANYSVVHSRTEIFLKKSFRLQLEHILYLILILSTFDEKKLSVKFDVHGVRTFFFNILFFHQMSYGK